MVFDSRDGTWDIRVADLKFSGQLPYTYVETTSGPSNKISKGHGKGPIACTLSVPEIMPRELHAAVPTHEVSGRNTVKLHVTFNAYDTADTSFIGFSGPVEAVITWTLTPDQQWRKPAA